MTLLEQIAEAGLEVVEQIPPPQPEEQAAEPAEAGARRQLDHRLPAKDLPAQVGRHWK